MSTFSFLLLAVGVFLLLYALVSLLRPGRGRKHESIGCGFTLLAGLVWGIALIRYLDSTWAGLRLGFAFALVLPALATLLRPGRGRVIAAVVTLTFAVILGAPVLPRLWAKVRPSAASASAEEVAGAADDLRAAVAETEQYAAQLSEDVGATKTRILQLGHPDFDSIAEDAKGYALLQELADVYRRIDGARDWLAAAQNDLAFLEVAERQLARAAQGEQAMRLEVDKAEIDRILTEGRTGYQVTPPITVEEHVEREALRDLFEQEFGL